MNLIIIFKRKTSWHELAWLSVWSQDLRCPHPPRWQKMFLHLRPCPPLTPLHTAATKQKIGLANSLTIYPSMMKLDEALSRKDAQFNAPSVSTCAGCHPQQYEEWQNSMHSMAFQDPVYLGELNLAVKAVGKEITKQCEGCHTAAAFLMGETEKEFDFSQLSPLAKAGVSCDVCHSIKAATHLETPTGEPENGSYILSPNKKDEKGGSKLTKYGPFPSYDGCGGGFHDCVESPLHRTSELCAGCHQVFHYKEQFPIEHTYAEWKKSIYSVKGVQCQDCHMVDIETFKRSADSFVLPKRGEYRHYFNGANFVQYLSRPG